MKSEYIEQLASALQSSAMGGSLPAETVLVCSSRAEGRRLLSAITEQGHILTGIRPETPFSLAQELCGLSLAQVGAPRYIEEAEGAELVRGCMDKNAGVFSGINAKSLAATRAIFRTFQEMALAGVPVQLPDSALTEQPKLQELQTLRETYGQKKQEQNLIDRADLLAIRLKFFLFQSLLSS